MLIRKWVANKAMIAKFNETTLKPLPRHDYNLGEFGIERLIHIVL